ncbi:MAG: hypothetical protein IPM74_15000 [Crocinitomicaceae bacterium]|nr:hypothetical protein [Crocinitomicaceae bacterium]MBK8927179.1 hypothetical protein [Crocinitomicaceae bacterium]
MLLKKIILRNQDAFENTLASWAEKQNIPVAFFDGKESLTDLVESLVILHEDYNISRENKELRELLESHHKSVHQVDINATMSASAGSLKFWLENNKPKNVLVTGDPSLIKNVRLTTFLDKLEQTLKG